MFPLLNTTNWPETPVAPCQSEKKMLEGNDVAEATLFDSATRQPHSTRQRNASATPYNMWPTFIGPAGYELGFKAATT